MRRHGTRHGIGTSERALVMHEKPARKHFMHHLFHIEDRRYVKVRLSNTTHTHILQLASLPPFNEPVPEQTFLGKHYEENAKKPDRDPRAAFRNTPDASGAGIVGPMGASTFSLPTVERALGEMEGGNSFAASVGPDGRKASRRVSLRVNPF